MKRTDALRPVDDAARDQAILIAALALGRRRKEPSVIVTVPVRQHEALEISPADDLHDEREWLAN